MTERPTAVVFDVGNVLYDWDPRFLYERLIEDGQALDAFLGEVVTKEWHFQHDEGRDFADTSAELAARYPEHAELIALWGPRFNETISGGVPGMAEIVVELDEAGVPLHHHADPRNHRADRGPGGLRPHGRSSGGA